MVGLFGGSLGGGGPIGLFGRTRGIGDEEQRRLAELTMLASELGGGLQSRDAPGTPREPLGERLVPPAQLSSPHRVPLPGGGGLPFEAPSNGAPFPPGLAGDPQVLGLPGAAGGSPSRSPIGGPRAEAEGYADQLAQRGTRQWGSAVRDFVMRGAGGLGNPGFHSDEDPTNGGFESAAEEEGFGPGPAAMQPGEFGQAEAEAQSLRPAAMFWEGEGPPTQLMRPAAFQGGASGRAVNRATRSRTAPEKAKTPNKPWIVQHGRYVPNPNWRNPAPNLEYYAAFGPPAGAAAAAAGGAAAALIPELVTFARLGRELKLGKNWRIAPFGNRPANSSPHPQGRWPHYHRRGTEPGQGIARHRPWQKKSPDTSFWDRF